MSKRGIRAKQARRMRKALSARPLDAYIDLVQWLQLHGHASTAGDARQMLKDGKVKTRSGHTVGREVRQILVNETAVDEYVPAPLIPAKHRAELVVSK